MSCKELRRAGVLARVKSGELTLVDAAVLMGMSYRESQTPDFPLRLEIPQTPRDYHFPTAPTTTAEY
jgi:hypothetical protein